VRALRLDVVEIAALCLIAAIVIAGAAFGSRLALYNLTVIALFATVAISLNLLLGLAGQASFAQTTFMAIGGYGLAILSKTVGLNPWLAIFIALLVSSILAMLIGRVLLRLRGHYLSMGTLALALGTYSFVNASTLTNGGWGISGVPALMIGDFSFRDPVAFLLLAWALCGASVLVYRLLGTSHLGRAWRALSTRQDVAATLGIDVPRYKLIALMIASVMATLAGGLYVSFTRFVGPDLYDIAQVINLMFMLFVGGLRSTVGPIVGAAFVILVPQLVAGLERYQNLVFFLLLLIVILMRPNGLFGRTSGVRTLASLLPARLRVRGDTRS
jgi:branched-chain amino acid transport system permease protein